MKDSSFVIIIKTSTATFNNIRRYKFDGIRFNGYVTQWLVISRIQRPLLICNRVLFCRLVLEGLLK